MKIEIKILTPEFHLQNGLPNYSTIGSAGLDLVCTEDLTVYPGETKQIKTGLAIHIKTGYTHKRLSDVEDVQIMGMIVPRSGLGSKGLILANTIGVIDEDYQGELLVNVWNRLDMNEYKQVADDGSCVVRASYKNQIELKAGDRFAQLIFVPVIKAKWDVVEEFSNTTERSEGGFGSTDK